MPNVLIRDRSGEDADSHAKMESEIRVKQPQPRVLASKEWILLKSQYRERGPDNTLILDFWLKFLDYRTARE